VPKLTEHQSADTIKLLLIGDSGTGKTGALASLALAGYNLYILDFDNGLDIVVKVIRAQKPEVLELIDYVSCFDKLKTRPADGVVIPVGMPKGLATAANALDKWPGFDHGVYNFGPNDIVVIDTLTHMGKAAMRWAISMNPTCKDPRQWYGEAQDRIESMLGYLYSPNVGCNVIVNAHIALQEISNIIKGYPAAIGKALGPRIPSYFNHMLQTKTKGSGKTVKRVLTSIPSGIVDLKSTVTVEDLPIETGLADFFKLVKGGAPLKPQ
jgi:hypothetical protein